MRRINNEDLQHVLYHTQNIWEDVRGKSIFITGATGFFGKWLLETFLYANHTLNLNANVCALSRNPDKFIQEFPFYKNEPNIRFIKGDIQNFEYSKEQFNYIIHAATDADAKLNNENPMLMLDTISIGAKHVLNFAIHQKELQGFLLTSSGAVYGKQPHDVTHVKETESFFIDINNHNSAYAEGKRLSELYCAIYNKQNSIPVKIARCFAFVGPYLPLDKHYAIGNFILNGLNNESIVIKGDGTPHRSYMYAADLAIWLWTILIKGKTNEPYNVGSDFSITIQQTAEEVIKAFNKNISLEVLGRNNLGLPTLRYVPNISKTKTQLALSLYINLNQAITKTINFYN